jgi:HK97 gp10 family phage protein
MISAAEFNQRITLQSKSVTRNSIGEEVVTGAMILRCGQKSCRYAAMPSMPPINSSTSLMRAKSKLDPYYWRWLEFGTKKMTARPFLKPAADRLPEALAAFEASAIPAIEALNKPGA